MNQGYGYGAGMHMRSYDIPISMALEATVNFMEPLPEEQAVHADCIQQLENLVSQVGPGWEVKAFGSAANGFLSRGADLDVTCFKPDIPDQDSQMSVQELKFQFLPLLNKQQAFEVIQEVWSARVPIIKLRFMDIIDVDLSCHNPQALQNTYLLRAYSHLSPHIRQLVLCVKCWAKAEAVCGAPSGHLSSYSFALMVIYFLQVDPLLGLPCLPVAGFSSQGPTISLESYPWMGRRPLYELLPRFFTFYAESFAWGSEVVSIRTGRRLMVLDPEYAALPGRQASRIHVEDPFLPRNLNCVLWPENE
ncbi:UTP:RNA uridylyltransferase 1, partial [Durusdinium trenchii]